MKKMKTKRKTIAKNIRMPLIAVFSLIIIMAAYSAYATSQGPTTIEKTVPTVEYAQTGTFHCLVYLENNTVYNTTVITPDQGKIFTRITNHINGSFFYNFDCNTTTMGGFYTVLAQIRTDDWSKTYTLTPRTEFNSNYFSTGFLINYTHFQNILDQINQETGVSAQNPVLLIKCKIEPAVTIDNHTIETFTPFLNISLGGSIIDIEGEGFKGAQSSVGTIDETQTIIQPAATGQRNISFVTAIFFAIFLIGFVTFTENKPLTAASKMQKTIKKFMKKYGEWIVEAEKIPKPEGVEILPIKTLDDLIKISEEIGKPVIHYIYKPAENQEDQHLFYVFDEDIHYEYALPNHEKIKKSTRCPKCNTKISAKGYHGETVHVTCPACGNKGTVSF